MAQIEFISLVVPAFKQEKTISQNIKQLDSALSKLIYKYEIIVVVDGVVDKTYQLAKKLSRNNIKVLKYDRNQGKGFAVKYGMQKAKGDVVGYIDAGMDIDPNGIEMLLSHMIWYDADIILGSKLHPVSQVDYPPLRRVLSWGYRTLTHMLFGFKVRDTQVGFKLFKRKVAEDVFSKLHVKTFAFDIEVLAVARHLGYKRIYEAPVKLNFGGVSSITSKSIWKIIILMLVDTFAVFYRLKIAHSYDKQV